MTALPEAMRSAGLSIAQPTPEMKPTSNIENRRDWTVVNGLLLLNKPSGITSNRALQRVKRALNARKAGHTGSLDPAATGMLPLCFGEATKVCAYLLDANKSYRVTAKLGEATDTADADGQVIRSAEVPTLSIVDWEKILATFLGEIQQVPPMYSALKRDGKRLYELARKGIVVDRPARQVRIDDIGLLEVTSSRLVLTVKCSKGTYIRSLVEDIAAAAGTVAHTSALHRDTVGEFKSQDMLDLETVERLADENPQELQERLLPPDAALSFWPELVISDTDGKKFSGGQAVVSPQLDASGQVRVYAEKGRFLGIGELLENRQLAPRRIFQLDPR